MFNFIKKIFKSKSKSPFDYYEEKYRNNINEEEQKLFDIILTIVKNNKNISKFITQEDDEEFCWKNENISLTIKNECQTLILEEKWAIDLPECFEWFKRCKITYISKDKDDIYGKTQQTLEIPWHCIDSYRPNDILSFKFREFIDELFQYLSVQDFIRNISCTNNKSYKIGEVNNHIKENYKNFIKDFL